MAGSAKGRQQGPFRAHFCASWAGVQCGQQFLRGWICTAAFHRNGALRRRWQELIGIKRMAHIIFTQPLQPGSCKESGIGLPISQLGQPRGNIAAKHHGFAIRPQVQQLRGAARRSTRAARGPKFPQSDGGARASRCEARASEVETWVKKYTGTMAQRRHCMQAGRLDGRMANDE